MHAHRKLRSPQQQPTRVKNMRKKKKNRFWLARSSRSASELSSPSYRMTAHRKGPHRSNALPVFAPPSHLVRVPLRTYINYCSYLSLVRTNGAKTTTPCRWRTAPLTQTRPTTPSTASGRWRAAAGLPLARPSAGSRRRRLRARWVGYLPGGGQQARQSARQPVKPLQFYSLFFSILFFSFFFLFFCVRLFMKFT